MFLRLTLMSLALALLFLATLLAMPAPALCADQGDIAVRGSTQVLTGSAIEDGGQATVVESRCEISLSRPLAGGRAGLGLSYNRADYSWSDTGDLEFGNGSDAPWDTLHSLGLDASYMYPVTAQWSVLTSAGISGSFENEMEDCFGFTGMVAAMYDPDNPWSFTLGVAVAHDPVHTQVLPAVSAVWASEQTPGLVAVLGLPESSLTYPLTDTVSVKGRVGLAQNTYRLAEDSVAASEGYASILSVDTGLDLVWRPGNGLELTLGAMYRPYGAITLYDNDRDEMDTWALHGGWGGRLGVGWEF